MISEEDLKRYGIKSVSTIAEGTLLPAMYIKHLDDTFYRYNLTREDMSGDVLNQIIRNHIQKVILKNRKEKLIRLNEL